MTYLFGLGDVAYYLFRPIVYLIDWFWGTDLKNCEKCKIRRKKWNDFLSVPTWAVLVLLLTLVLFVITN